MKRLEQAFQIELCRVLDRDYPQVLYVHISNGVKGTGKRAMIQGAIQKAMGVKAGIPDLILWWHDGVPRCGAIELKAGKGRLNPNQIDMHTRLKIKGVPVATCKTIEEVAEILKTWGIPRIPKPMVGW